MIKILHSARRHPVLTLLIAVFAFCFLNFAINVWIESRTFDCNQPPAGVIRFTLSSGQKDASKYEWRDKVFQQVGTTPIGKAMLEPYPEDSYYNPTIWGSAVQGINRQAAGDGSLLRTPYSISPDRRWFVAGIGTEFDLTTRIAFVSPNTSKPINIVDLHEAIDSLAWDPQSRSVVVLSHDGHYGLNPLSLFGGLFGHPISYSNMTLSIIEPTTGAIQCRIHPARGLRFGSGYVRWDSL